MCSPSQTSPSYPDNSKRYVWLYDDNVDYLSRKHIYLFTTAITFLFVVVLPYTLVLVFGQSLQAKSEWKILSWVNKLRPLFDAYTGPYRDKYTKTTGIKNVSPGYAITLYILTDFLQLESIQRYGIRASVPKQKQTPSGSEDITERSE